MALDKRQTATKMAATEITKRQIETVGHLYLVFIVAFVVVLVAIAVVVATVVCSNCAVYFTICHSSAN